MRSSVSAAASSPLARRESAKFRHGDDRRVVPAQRPLERRPRGDRIAGGPAEARQLDERLGAIGVRGQPGLVVGQQGGDVVRRARGQRAGARVTEQRRDGPAHRARRVGRLARQQSRARRVRGGPQRLDRAQPQPGIGGAQQRLGDGGRLDRRAGAQRRQGGGLGQAGHRRVGQQRAHRRDGVRLLVPRAPQRRAEQLRARRALASPAAMAGDRVGRPGVAARLVAGGARVRRPEARR